MTEPTGYTAVGMVGFTDKGTYSASASYVKNDLVHYGGSIWCCLIDDTTGITPTEGVNWRFWVEDSQNGISDIVNVLGAKNLLKISATSQVKNGVTFTVNDDGSITVDGTATAVTYLDIMQHDFGNARFSTDGFSDSSDYILSGVPKSTDFYIYYDGSSKKVIIAIKSGYTVDNVRVYPMIRPSGIEDATWQPYAKTNKKLTEEVTQNSSDIQTLTNEASDIVNVLSAKNLFDNTMATQVVSGVTYTVNSDKSITANGTATASASNLVGTFDFKAGVTYVLSGCPSGGSTSTYLLSIEGAGYDSGNGYEYTPSSDVTKNIMLTIFNGVAIDNLVFKPMICTKSVYEADNTYVPYAMTNRELTEVAQTLDSTTWNTTSAINGINVAYRKKNGIVFVRRNTSAATYTANTLVTIGNLPQGFRPSFTIQAVIQNDTAVVTIIISADGTVKILSTTGNGIPAFCLSFPL